MEKTMNSIKTPDPVFEQTKEQPVNADLILPDYYPEISKLLDCNIEFSEEAVTINADKICISCAAMIRLMYTSAENELKVFNSVTKYNKNISGSHFEESDICIVRQTKSALNYKAVSPRKVEINAVAAVKVNVYRLKESAFVCETADPCIQTRKRNLQGFSVHAFSSVMMELTENISLPASKETVSECIRNSVNISFTEIRAINNKVMLTGTAEIRFVYFTKENKICDEQTVSVPFTQVKDLYGVQENDNCKISICNAKADISIREKDEENQTADITVTCLMLIVSGSKNELCIIDDAYAVKGKINIITNRNMLISDTAVFSLRSRFDGEILTYDTEPHKILDQYVTDIKFTTNKKEGSLEINGNLEIKLLAKTADGAYYCFAKSVSFSDTLKINDSCIDCMLSVSPGSISAKKGADGKINVSGDLNIDVLLLNGQETGFITDISFEPDEDIESQERIVLYYGTKGEQLWDIAKENKTPVTALKELNTLEEDVLSEDRLLVFRN